MSWVSPLRCRETTYERGMFIRCARPAWHMHVGPRYWRWHRWYHWDAGKRPWSSAKRAVALRTAMFGLFAVVCLLAILFAGIR